MPHGHRSQAGWVGMVVLLIALVIVVLVAQTALRQYGLLGTPAAPAKSEERARAPDAAPPSADVSPAAPASRNPIERARGVEQTVQQGAQDLSRRIDEQTK